MLKQAASKAALLLVSLGASLVLCEIVLRLVSPSAYYVWRPGTRTVCHPRPEIMPGVSGPTRFTINASGIRGDDFAPDQSYRILAIGGSTTECLYLDDSEIWTRLLQERLSARVGRRIWVGNVGKGGHNSRDHLMATHLLLDQYPRIDAIVVLTGVNDLHQTLAKDTKYRPFPGLDALSDEAFQRQVRRTFSVYRPRTLSGLPLHRQTRLWQRLEVLRQSFSDAAYKQELDGRNYVAWRSFRRAATAIRQALPDLTAALDEYARNLKSIASLARQRRVRPIFVTQPTLWRPDLEPELEELLWLGGVGDYMRSAGSEYYSVTALAEGMEVYNDVLRRVCGEEGVECVDLARSLPKDLTALYDDCHFNESGARQVAAALAEHLLQDGRRQLLVAASEAERAGQAGG